MPMANQSEPNITRSVSHTRAEIVGRASALSFTQSTLDDGVRELCNGDLNKIQAHSLAPVSDVLFHVTLLLIMPCLWHVSVKMLESAPSNSGARYGDMIII